MWPLPDCSKCEAEVNRLRQENAELINIIDLLAQSILNLTTEKPPVPVPDFVKLVYRFS